MQLQLIKWQVKYGNVLFYKTFITVNTESSIILAKYFPFSQLPVAGFQI